MFALLTVMYYLSTSTTDFRIYRWCPTLKRSLMNFHTSYSRPLRNGTRLFLIINCLPNQTGLTSSRMTQTMDTYIIPPSMLTGTTYTDIRTRNLALATRRFSSQRSDLCLVFRPTMTTTPPSIESSDTTDEYLTKTHGRKLSFRECYHLACDRNPICACMEHDLREADPQEKPENPTSEPTKYIKANNFAHVASGQH